MAATNNVSLQDFLKHLQQAVNARPNVVIGSPTVHGPVIPPIPVISLVGQQKEVSKSHPSLMNPSSSSDDTARQTITPSSELSSSSQSSSVSPPQLSYTYKVKIINPSKKSDTTVRFLNNFHQKFESISMLQSVLTDELQRAIPSSNFSVGYYNGCQQSKIWLMTDDDLKTMYVKNSNGGQISLWCDGISQDSDIPVQQRKKKDLSIIGNSHIEKEDMDSIFEQLLKKHGSAFDKPKLRLWSKMIVSGIHDSYSDPPDIPLFHSDGPPKKKQRTDISDALTGAAIAFAEAIGGKSKVEECKSTNAVPQASTMSPSKKVELRMKNYEQLRYLQQLHDDGILDSTEYQTQKQTIINFLNKL